LTEPRVLALDVQYVGERAFIGAACGPLSGPYDELSAEADTPADYEPGYFARREGPLLVAMTERVLEDREVDLLVIDGHGLAHPRRSGVACFVGRATDLPTVGIAKETLVRYTGTLDEPRGSTLPVLVDGDTVGYVVRTQDGVRPVFASPGHRLSVDEARDWALRLPSTYRISEPQRAADRLCRARSRGEEAGIDLGELRYSAQMANSSENASE
jgi:deoxyribonuclease V